MCFMHLVCIGQTLESAAKAAACWGVKLVSCGTLLTVLLLASEDKKLNRFNGRLQPIMLNNASKSIYKSEKSA